MAYDYDSNYSPNFRFDNGPAAAGSTGISSQTKLTEDTAKGVGADGVLVNANHRVGLNAAGVPKNNPGPNVIGAIAWNGQSTRPYP